MLAATLVFTTGAEAACYATYKAKRDDPLRLHYGVAEVTSPDCTPEAASVELAPRLALDGWILLAIVEMIDADKLGEVRKSAGDYFLRY
ncbi:hypothetical protein [Celeribacter arenosi]|uniref:Uncharacterized protein n=1 Tax=Celeribacter arenosi TaxID=792649 RepID=A0ABP7JWL0_9RHOB